MPRSPRPRPALRAALGAGVLLFGGAALSGGAAGAAPAASPAASPAAATAGSTVLVGHLASPAAFAVAGNGTVYYAELFGGVVKAWDPATRRSRVVLPIPNGAGGQTIGMALRGSTLYFYSVRKVAGVQRLQLSRISVAGRTGTGFRVLHTVAVRPEGHAGGPLLVGPDGMLYLSVGDQDQPANAQNRSNDFGKVLRMTPSGGIPAGASSRIFAYGLRNTFGLAFDPATKRLWGTDNGPECNDEINLISRGGNYGWGPAETCSTPPPAPRNTNQDGPSPLLPKAWYGATTAPTGAVFSGGALLYGTFKTNQIRKVTLNASRTAVTGESVLLTNPAPVLSMARGPGGRVYFADTSAIRVLR